MYEMWAERLAGRSAAVEVRAGGAAEPMRDQGIARMNT
jgi:hypothetical protein